MVPSLGVIDILDFVPKLNMLTPAIEIKNLTRTFGKVAAVDDLSFKVEQGEVVGFLGPNGAGKRMLGYMPELNPLPEELRVSEYFRMRAALKNMPRKQRRANIKDAMELCDLHRTVRHHIIGNLSKGFKQRVGIADTLLGKPDVIIMDEPTIGLDPHQVLGIRKLINRLRGKVAVIISSHILSEIDLCCDRVIIINHGRLVGQGTPRELRRRFLPERSYEIAVSGSEASIKDALAPLKDICKIDRIGAPDADGFRECILVSSSEDSVLPEIARCLAGKSDLKLGKLVPRAAALEDIFLAATRQSWKEEDKS